MLALALGGHFWQKAARADLSGEEIYAKKCAACHGARGEGGKKHKRPLQGDRSTAQLAELIGETMPEDNPGSLSSAEAAAVATWVHDTFYSAIARERNRPARVELARLTVRQYRQSLTDLIGSFREMPAGANESLMERGGLSGEYFSGRRFGRNEPAARRIDGPIDFDFKTDSPVSEIAEPHEFSIRWKGSILADETGEYEFVVRTEHAGRLWVNDTNRPLIDAWVKSGSETAYKASLFLVGGRAYPVRLEFSKAKQGVDDSKKQKEKPPSAPASIALLWKPPGRVLEPIPARHLSQGRAREEFVCATPFPPDDRSYGWERGTAISKAWDQSTTEAALDAAGYVAAHINDLAGIGDADSDRSNRLRSFFIQFAERAFRRPTGDEETSALVDRQMHRARSEDELIKRVVLLVLKSPRFLYREVGGAPQDAWNVAARLSFGLWDSLPDQEFLKSAAEGRLATRDGVAGEAARMLADPRAKTKIRAFLLTWLRADTAGEIAKDAQLFGEFDARVVSDLRTSLELFLDDIVWSGGSDFRQLLLAEDVYLNDRLKGFFASEIPPDNEAAAGGDYTKVRLDDGKRAGVLTHPYLMAAFAHSRDSSPIHRGLFLARGVLGQTLRPPPEAVVPLSAELHPGLTTRERVILQTQAASCMTCHAIINPLGFALEHFDAVGRYRETDRDKPVDATGNYHSRTGAVISVQGARQLAEFVASSDEAHAAFTEQLFHHLVQQPVRAYGEGALEDFKNSFARHSFSVQKLIVEIMVASALHGRENPLVTGK